ncbi:MAG: hypothetical protein WC052_05115 [Patescibacteria group bacterium]
MNCSKPLTANAMLERSNVLNRWSSATESLAWHFVQFFFGIGTTYYWAGNDIGGVLCVNDYFFDMNDIVDFTRFNYNQEQMFAYYNYRIDCNEIEGSKPPLNIKTWIKLDHPGV